MSTIYEQDFTIDGRAVDLTGCARPSALLGYLQEAAMAASLALGVSTPETIEKYHAFWMVSRTWLRLDAPLRWNDRVRIRTWHRGGRGVSCLRDFELLREGSPIGEAVSVWVLADVDTYRLLRLGGVAELAGTDGGGLCKALTPHGIKLPQPMTDRGLRPMGYSDTDINGHVSNVRYADFACDALHLEKLLPGRFVRELQLSYLGQCWAGETLALKTAIQGVDHYAGGFGPTGEARFACRLQLAEA